MIIGPFIEFIPTELHTTDVLEYCVFYKQDKRVIRKTKGKRKIIRSSTEEIVINDVVEVEDIKNSVSIVFAGVAIL